MAQYEDLRTIKQLAAENPAFTEASLRWLVFNARHNGLHQAIIHVGRRVLIDKAQFVDWLNADSRRELKSPHDGEESSPLSLDDRR